jgi:hypothetical protein
MNLITFREPITIAFKKSAGGLTITFEAGRDYLIANAQLERILRDANVISRVYRISKADTRIENFHVGAFTPCAHPRKNNRILLFNGSGGYGDQILTWPVAKVLHDRGYEVHVMTDPGNNVCWWNLKFARSVLSVPCLWEQVKLFDVFMPFEAVVNMDEHPDQGHPVDMMLAKIGIDPESIAAEAKCVRPVFTEGELGALVNMLKLGKKIGIYQLAAANPVRCLPVSDSIFMLLKIAEATPNTHWLALYDEFVPAEYKTTLEAAVVERKLENVQAFCSPNLRELWALTEHVSVVVSPDSMMVHVAGVFGTPCVGLWGPMDPINRVKYYKNHHPLWYRQFCPHTPCFAYANVFPKYCPPRPDARKSCDVLAGISPTEVIKTIKEVQR